jgi:hypothetical protein
MDAAHLGGDDFVKDHENHSLEEHRAFYPYSPWQS